MSGAAASGRMLLWDVEPCPARRSSADTGILHALGQDFQECSFCISHHKAWAAAYRRDTSMTVSSMQMG